MVEVSQEKFTTILQASVHLLKYFFHQQIIEIALFLLRNHVFLQYSKLLIVLLLLKWLDMTNLNNNSTKNILNEIELESFLF